jgi:UDPglucose--hexose-1-phosphate uridylyltransferase
MVLEYRRDEGKDALIVFSTERAKRPVVRGEKEEKACPFCKGSERLTPPTTFALPGEKDWRVRSFRNLFAIVKPEGQFRKGRFPTAGYGEHEVIVETPNHGELFQSFDEKQLALVFKAYKHRLAELALADGVEYVTLFKNHGAAAGASIEHEHAQVLGLPFVPPLLAKEAEHADRYQEERGACYHCLLLEGEGKRNQVLQNTSFRAFCPSVARFPMEFWLVPRQHKGSMLEFTDREAKDFMLLLRETLARLQPHHADYVVAFHNAPAGSKLHFHAEVYPRRGAPHVWAGLELGSGVIVNSRDEREAAQLLRG